MINSKNKITVVILCLIVVVVVVMDFFIRNNQSPFKVVELSRSKGDTRAPYQIIEFVDFQCSECARGYRFLKNMMERYPDKFFLTLKYYPLAELNSAISARYAHCAALQEKFWPYHDLLFEKQTTWRTLDNVEPYLKSLAKDVGLDQDLLSHCIVDNATRKTIFQERILGESHFVRVTPTYFVNNEMVVGLDELRKKLTAAFKLKDGDL